MRINEIQGIAYYRKAAPAYPGRPFALKRSIKKRNPFAALIKKLGKRIKQSGKRYRRKAKNMRQNQLR